MKTKPLTLTVSMLLALIALVPVVHAGLNSASYVRVYSSSAFGPVHDARFNSGSTEYIGCSISSYSSGGGHVYCSARDAQNDFLSCYNYSPSAHMRHAVSSINEASNIEFYVNNSGTCTSIYVANYSNRL